MKDNQSNTCFTRLIFHMLFNPFKMAIQFFKTASNFPNFDDPNVFSEIQQAFGPDFRTVGKSLGLATR